MVIATVLMGLACLTTIFVLFVGIAIFVAWRKMHSSTTAGSGILTGARATATGAGTEPTCRAYEGCAVFGGIAGNVAVYVGFGVAFQSGGMAVGAGLAAALHPGAMAALGSGVAGILVAGAVVAVVAAVAVAILSYGVAVVAANLWITRCKPQSCWVAADIQWMAAWSTTLCCFVGLVWPGWLLVPLVLGLATQFVVLPYMFSPGHHVNCELVLPWKLPQYVHYPATTATAAAKPP